VDEERKSNDGQIDAARKTENQPSQSKYRRPRYPVSKLGTLNPSRLTRVDAPKPKLQRFL
jgi:hypothetical protein